MSTEKSCVRRWGYSQRSQWRTYSDSYVRACFSQSCTASLASFSGTFSRAPSSYTSAEKTSVADDADFGTARTFLTGAGNSSTLWHSDASCVSFSARWHSVLLTT